MVEMNEQQVVNSLKRKDQDAFNYLYDNYAHLLYAVVLKIAEDEAATEEILRRVFATIWEGIDEYKPGMKTPLVWMLEIARNIAIETIQAKPEILDRKLLAPDAKLDIETSNGDTYIIKLATLQPTPQPQYEVVLKLVYYKGFTVQDVAVSLGLSEAAIALYLRKALTQLRENYPFKADE